MKKNNKLKLVGLVGAMGVTLLGSSLAFFTTSDEIPNVFNTARYSNTIQETFKSPDKWTPGTTTEKVVTVTNTGNVDMAVRARITESWQSADGTQLDGTFFKDGDSLKELNENSVVTIDINEEDYSKDENGYYVLNTDLKAGETSPAFIKSVTLNSDLQLGDALDKTVSDDGKTITYTSTNTGYDGAKYTLTVHIDTVQADQKANAWK